VPRRSHFWLALWFVLAFLPGSTGAQRAAPAPLSEVSVAQLPAEARATLGLIRKGGPYRYERDGIVFGNFEKHLPVRERGYYREYTVPTPGARSRGARRIVVGRGGEAYYTDDHYNSFKRVGDW
jgi:ribonuclease T1